MQLTRLVRKLRKFGRYFYDVPWCVPPWGWEEARRIAGALTAGHIVSGNCATEFVGEIKDFLNMKYAIPINHARFGVELALKAIGVTGDDDVILPSYLCQSVLEAVVRCGARPVFADVGTDLHVSAAEVRRLLGPRTRCVIVPHLFGNVAPVDEIAELLENTGIALIDDAAQSLGATCRGRKIGTFGTFGLVSIGPGKSLAGPAGGVLLTNHEELYRRAAAIPLPGESSGRVLRRILAFWLWRRCRRWTWPFYIAIDRLFHPPALPESAAPMSNLDAAIGLIQLRKLSQNAAVRKRNASAMCQWLGELGKRHISDFGGMLVRLVIVLPESAPRAADFVEALADAGVEAQIGYSPLHRSTEAATPCPSTDVLWDRVLCIPVDTAMRRHLSPLHLEASC